MTPEIDRTKKINTMKIIRCLDMLCRENSEKTILQLIMAAAVGDNTVDSSEFHNFLSNVNDETILDNLQKMVDKERSLKAVKQLEKKLEIERQKAGV